MENKKTISYLNSKTWYRLLKVIFIFIFLITCLVTVINSFDVVGSYQDDYLVVCNMGNKNTFLAYKDKKIYVPSYNDYTDSLAKLPDNIKKDLVSACAISEGEMSTKLDKIFNGTDDGNKFYDLTPTKVITDTYLTASLWSILSIFIIFLVFEIIKRAFYYIVLGSLKPVK